MAIKDRQQREKEKLRKKILNTASKMLLKDGYEKLSMRKIAEKIEYSPTAIYLYFKDKEDLVFNIIEDGFAVFVKKFDKISKSKNDAVTRLKSGLKVYIETGMGIPELYRIMFLNNYHQQISNLDDCAPLENGAMNERAFHFLINSISDVVKEKKLKHIDVNLTGQIFWSSIHGLTSLLITQKGFPWFPEDQLIDNLIDTLMKTLEE